LDVLNAAKQKKHKSYTNSGVLCIEKCELIKVNTFLEYIAGGCEISLIVAIDFTASNGYGTLPENLGPTLTHSGVLQKPSLCEFSSLQQSLPTK